MMQAGIRKRRDHLYSVAGSGQPAERSVPLPPICHFTEDIETGVIFMAIDEVRPAEAFNLEDLKAFKKLGVRILIDNRERPEKEWDIINRVSESDTDGVNTFYMADFIAAPNGEIIEIRLDKVTIRKL